MFGSKQSKLLAKYLTKASVFEDVIPFLKLIDLNTVRTFVYDQLCNRNVNVNVSECVPLTDLLHENVIQHQHQWFAKHLISYASKM